MATLTIRQLDERTHARLRARAAKHGRSVVVRAILGATVGPPEENFLLALHAAMSEDGGVDDRWHLPCRRAPAGHAQRP